MHSNVRNWKLVMNQFFEGVVDNAKIMLKTVSLPGIECT